MGPGTAAALAAPTTAMPTLLRRYSITGQPDDVQMKSPKLQGLDTTVQTTECQLCESGYEDGHLVDLVGAPHDSPTRTSSKRSATQLPSPTTPSSHELPTKIARLRLEHGYGYIHGGFSEPFPNIDLASSLASSDCPCSSDTDDVFGDIDVSADGPVTPKYALHLPVYQAAICDSPAYSSDDIDDTLSSTRDVQAQSPPTTLSSTPGTTPSNFCTLPPEIRHQIYLRLPDVVVPYPLIYCLSTFGSKKQHPLASVSRLIRSEALAIFYSYNTWFIKVEHQMMYDAFQDWIISLGDNAGSLRIVNLAVRGSLFKPFTRHNRTAAQHMAFMNPGFGGPGGIGGHQVQIADTYSPPDGDASFRIDLSEKWPGGKVETLRNDGTLVAGDTARRWLMHAVKGLWEKRREGTLNGQHWVTMVDQFLYFVGCRL